MAMPATQIRRGMVLVFEGGPVRVVSRSLDRNFVHPAWSGDGKWIYAQLEDDEEKTTTKKEKTTAMRLMNTGPGLEPLRKLGYRKPTT